MTTFLALYRGETPGSSRLLALTADPEVVREFAARLLKSGVPDSDPVLREFESGRRRALKLVADEAGE